MKKLLAILFIVTMCFCGIIITCADCEDYTVTGNVVNVRSEPNTNCSVLGKVCRGETLKGEALSNGWTQIEWGDKKAYVYSAYTNKNTKVLQPSTSGYTQEDLDLLSRVIYAEAGSDWLTDEHQLAVGSVVLNRVADSRFPDTIKGVIYQKGQYGCVPNGMIKRAPSERAINNAKHLLENGVTIPTNVVWQAQFKQGKGVWKNIQGHYFCY